MAKKKKHAPADGLGPREVENIRKAIRQVWQRSHVRKLCVNRCIGKGGYSYCEKCKRRAPKVFIDHIEAVGDVDGGFIHRLFCPSIKLQGLCDGCHREKTAKERMDNRLKLKKAQSTPDDYDFS